MNSLQQQMGTKWVKEYFLDHPEASIDAAAREATRARVALHKSEIARIRREIRQAIDAGQLKPTVTGRKIQRPAPEQQLTIELDEDVARVRVDRSLKGPFNPPHIKLLDDDPEADMTVEEVTAVEAAGGSTKAATTTAAVEPEREEAQQVSPTITTTTEDDEFSVSDQPEMAESPAVAKEPDMEMKPLKPQKTGLAKKLAPKFAAKPAARKASAPKAGASSKGKIQKFLGADDPKVRWAAAQAEKDPTETTLSLNRRVAQKFGSGFQMPTLGEIVRAARESAGLPMKAYKKTSPRRASSAVKMLGTPVAQRGRPRKGSPVDGLVKQFAQALAKAGVYGTIETRPNGEFAFNLHQRMEAEYSGRGHT